MKTRSTSLTAGIKQTVLRQKLVLSTEITEALATYSLTKRKQRSTTAWFATCTESPAAAVFFKGARDSMFSRITACDVIAEAYHELHAGGEIEVISPSMVYKVRAQANSMLAMLPARQYLPSEATTSEFRMGLEALCSYTRPVLAQTNRSGDPTRRALTLALAKRFAEAFGAIPVDYVHYLVTIAWPTASASATRRVLTSDVTEKIKEQCSIELKATSAARTQTHLALQAARSTKSLLSSVDSETIEDLEEQIGRIKRGARRFPTDASSLRAMLMIVNLLQDPALAEELRTVLANQLQDYLA